MSKPEKEKKPIDINSTLSITQDNIVKTGTLVKTDELVVDRDFGVMLEKGITLDDLHTFYVEHNNSGEETYQYFTNYLNENKNNPEVINNTVSSILAELVTKYDKTNIEHGEVGGNQAEYLSTVFSTGKGEETNALICGTIHNFLRDSLQDAGIEAVTVIGADNSYQKGFTNHACLLYKNSDGTYQFNNYGKSATIEANNIKDAVYTVHKETGLLESGGQITLHDKNNSYQEYALSESSAYGNLMDKRDYNAQSPFDNPVSTKTGIDAYGNVSTTGNIKGGGEATFSTQTDNSAQSTIVGIEYRHSGENAEFYNSNSIGIKGSFAKTKALNETNALTYDINGIFSHTKGELGGNVEDMSYESLMLKGSVGVQTQIYGTENTNIYNSGKASLISTGVLGHSNHYSSSYDARLILEDGISISNNQTNQNFNGNISGGVVIDTQQDNNGMKPVIGGKLNIGTGYTVKANDNLLISANAEAYSVFTKASTDSGVQANVGAIWTNPNSDSKINCVFGTVGASAESQNLHIGKFTQLTEKNVTFQATAGMEVGKNTRVSLNYSQHNDTLNPTKNTKTFGVSVGVKF